MLTLQFIPYSDIAELSPDARVKKILSIVKDDKILVMEGRLKKTERQRWKINPSDFFMFRHIENRISLHQISNINPYAVP